MRQSAVPPRSRRLCNLPARLALAVFAGCLAVYAATAARGPCWGDSPELVAVARTLGVAHPPGYPLYTLLGALAVRIPVGDPSFRLSLMSAVFGAAAAGIVTALTWRLLSMGQSARNPVGDGLARAAGSVLAGASFAFSGAVWSQATVPEVYTLSAFLLLAVLFVLADWACSRPAGSRERRCRTPDAVRTSDVPRLALLGLLLGLALAHHLTALLVVPSAALIVFAGPRGRPSARGLASAVTLAVVALSLYAYLPIRAAQDPPLLWARVDSPAELLRHVSGAQYAGRLFSGPAVEALHRLVTRVAALPGHVSWAVLAMAAVGIVSFWRRSRPVLLALALYAVLVFVHVVGYRIPDPEAYYIPIHAVLCILAGIGLAAAAAVPRRPLAAALLVIAFAAVALHGGLQWRVRDLRERSDARVYMQRMLEAVRPEGIVVAQNDGTVFPLWYARYVEGVRQDIAIVDVRERAPRLERRYPRVRFPSEEELSTYLSRVGARGFGHPLRETVPVAAYVPLFFALNEGSRPVYAELEIGRKTCPHRSVPRGLIAEIAPGSSRLPSPAFTASERARWDAYLAGLEGVPAADRRTLAMYATMLGETGSLLLVRGERSSAIEALERATALAPWLPQQHNNLGIAYQVAGRFDDAVRQFETTLKLRPGLAETEHNIYAASLSKGDLSRAAASLERAVRLDPANRLYAHELAALRRGTGRAGRAASLTREPGPH